MRGWVKLLPWFLVVRLARRHCETLTVDGKEWLRPFCPGPLLSKADPPTDAGG